MTSNNMLERIQRAFREALDDQSLLITEHTSPSDLPQWDSMFQINLILAIEEEFGVHFTSKDASRLNSVQAISEILNKQAVQA